MFDSDRRATTDVTAAIASSFVFRGQVMTDRPVAQGTLAVNLPAKTGGTTSFRVFGNLDLDDDTGRAWMDGGHAGEFTQLELSAVHAERFGDVDASVGLVQYTWPHGETFRFTPFPNTAEVFGRVGTNVLGFTPAVTVHYDIDEVESVYVRGEIGRGFELSKDVRIDVLGWLAWSDADHSMWLYRTPVAALADAGLEARLGWQLDVVTTLECTLAGSTIVDDELRDWFRPRIDADNVWLALGIAWRF